jgi:hypothetical protein
MMRMLSIILFLGAAAGFSAACGDDDAAPTGTAPGATAVPGAAQPGQPAAGASAAPSAPRAAASGLDPEREWEIFEHCKKRAAADCAEEERDRGAYYRARQARIIASPFKARVDRVFLAGTCARGDDPAKRKNTSGIRAVVEGTLTYTGSDMLYLAELRGAAYLRFGADRYTEAEALGRAYTGGWYGGTKVVSRLEREVRGADPWLQGQERPFHWESQPLSEAFCETLPDEAKVHVELVTRGIRGGRQDSPVAVVDLAWDELVGMGLKTQVQVVIKQKDGVLLEPADAHYGCQDRILVTRLTGKTEWLKRTQVVQPADFGRAPAAAFPVQAGTTGWKITVSGITGAREFGGYAPKGEDQFLAVVDIELANNGAEASSLKGFTARLESAPGRWQGPVTKAVGQIDAASTVEPGGSLAGKLVFARQRFERPFRLEVKTPDKETVLLDVLSYDLGPERAPK